MFQQNPVRHPGNKQKHDQLNSMLEYSNPSQRTVQRRMGRQQQPKTFNSNRVQHEADDEVRTRHAGHEDPRFAER